MATTRKSTTIPTEGKHIRYERETRDYSCYLDGQYIGSADTYGHAEEKVNQVYMDRLLDETAILADEQAERDAEREGELVITHKDGDWTAYTLGIHTLSVEGAGADRGVSLFRGGHELISFTSDVRYPGELTGPESFAALRALAQFLDHPTVRQVIGMEPPPPPCAPVVRVERYDDGEGFTGARFVSGGEEGNDKTGVEVFIPDAPTDNPYTRPVLYAWGRDEITLAVVERTLPFIQAVLSDARMRQAWRRWEASATVQSVKVAA
jgi:hypothetical protein